MSITEIKTFEIECDICHIKSKFESAIKKVPAKWKDVSYTVEGSHGAERHYSLETCWLHSDTEIKEHLRHTGAIKISIKET